MTSEQIDPGLAIGQVGGVRCHWVERSRATLTASLAFRVGIVDEALPNRGWVHLVEHLAHGRLTAPGPLATNASVGPSLTTFQFHGPTQEVWAAVARTMEFLADPDLDRARQEAEILRAEESYRGNRGPLVRAFLWRYGLRGLGTMCFDEVFLDRLDLTETRTLIARHFTDGNAVLLLDGEPPAELPAVLAKGPRRPQEVVPASTLVHPGGYPESGLVLSGVVPRTHGATALPPVLEWHLTQQLREQERISYAPFAHYESASGDEAVVLAGADLSGSATSGLVDRTLAALDELSHRGPDQQLLDGLIKARHQQFEDSDNRFFVTSTIGEYWLVHDADITAAELAGKWDDLDSEMVAADLREWRKSLIVGHSEESNPQRLIPIRAPVSEETLGTRFRSAHRSDPSTILITADSVSLRSPGNNLALRFDELASVREYNDGGLVLHDLDAWPLAVYPGDWQDGDILRRSLLERVPETAVRLRSNSPLQPNPVDPVAKRRWDLRALGVALLSVLACVLVAESIVALIAPSDRWVPGLPAISLLVGIWSYRLARR